MFKKLIFILICAFAFIGCDKEVDTSNKVVNIVESKGFDDVGFIPEQPNGKALSDDEVYNILDQYFKYMNKHCIRREEMYK